MLTKEIQKEYCAILEDELQRATGCTEPIAIAYCAAKLREVFEGRPTQIIARVSGNILKNVKSVVVPNTAGRRGIPAAIAVGFLHGDSTRQLQVIADVAPEAAEETGRFLSEVQFEIRHAETPYTLDIELEAQNETCTASARVAEYHTNLVSLVKNGEVLLQREIKEKQDTVKPDKSLLNLADIVSFAEETPLPVLKELLQDQVQCNKNIALEGMKNAWGSRIGSLLLKRDDSIVTKAKAYAAAGSDARMNGCEMPVVILSGSGNQGITACVPVLCYAREMNISEEEMYRALAVSDLTTLHIKTGIGLLSAYCGAICAGIGAGAGIAYMHEKTVSAVEKTVSNAAAILSGTICDGAKASCAAKIAESVDAGILGYQMYKEDANFIPGDGIVGSCAEETIVNVGVLGSRGMTETDRVILKIMEQ